MRNQIARKQATSRNLRSSERASGARADDLLSRIGDERQKKGKARARADRRCDGARRCSTIIIDAHRARTLLLPPAAHSYARSLKRQRSIIADRAATKKIFFRHKQAGNGSNQCASERSRAHMRARSSFLGADAHRRSRIAVAHYESGGGGAKRASAQASCFLQICNVRKFSSMWSVFRRLVASLKF